MAASLRNCCRRSTNILGVLKKHTSLSQRQQSDATTSSKFEDLKDEYPEVEFSTAEYKYVERLLPSFTVPPAPAHTQYPTPSGWTPCKVSGQDLPYAVNRTRNHMFPVYLTEEKKGPRALTKIKHIQGDIWALEADLRNFLGMDVDKPILTQVHEVSKMIRIRGDHTQGVSNFFLEKGF